MAIKLGINGSGRIGRKFAGIASHQNPLNLEVSYWLLNVQSSIVDISKGC